MNYDEKLLIEIHRCADMGQSTLDRLAPHIDNGGFRSLVDKQREEYNRVFIAADAKLKAIRGNDSGAPRAALMMGGIMADMRASVDNSSEHLSEVVLKGIEKGIKDIDHAMSSYSAGATPETRRLATQLREYLAAGKEKFNAFTD